MAIERTVASQNDFLPSDQNSLETLKVDQSRAMQEVQAGVIMAKKFPRDQNQAFSNIIRACQRKSLAEVAMYAYPRGGKTVTGESIRIAKVMAQSWGNINYGLREISNKNGVSIVQAIAWDLETNTKIVREFTVPHKRYTKQGSYDLTDPRDIYEMVANQGARRLRSCILDLIPADIREAAIEQCKETLKKDKEPIQDRIKKLVIAFDGLGIKVNHLEENLGHSLDSVIESEIVTLRTIYQSIKDGEVRREDFFDLSEKDKEDNKSTNKTEKLKEKLKNNNKEQLKQEETKNQETDEWLSSYDKT